MKYNAGILGIGANIPEKIVNNEEIAKRFGIKEEEIIRKTGIMERRYEEPETTLTEMSVIAGKRAIEDAGVDPKEIDLVIIGTNTHDTHITAALVQHEIGAETCAGLDLHSGCSSFITALATGAQFVQTGLYKNVLVVAVDKCSSLLNPMDKKTALIFSDGAAAVVVGRVPEDKGILGIHMQMDGSGGKYLHLDENKNIKMDGRAVFEFAVEKFPEAVKTVLKVSGHQLEEVDFIIPHQSNLRIIETGLKTMEFPMEKVHTHTIQYYGNSSAPTIPIGLYEEVKAGNIKEGDLVVLAGYGAGLGWGGITLRWGK
ncbi:3-oxoacyl-[acyl-carrier-protein] synthase 3 protein 1 [Bacillus sp. THAF10]|uniref:3-oxoacyl-ACP synthase III family protein n=1 Tax=Bacillus sp. THAF10 TaxID=2587848 RepID=UPI00126863AB|nr:ketoacyl-ACP synthase III [Bacillus sp. THAF10]QFT89702.1 3-oxoacyl-[acyl-carrier-protein] synthase 3 protein 1 [Bacillus sp. THAF10]